MFVGLNSSERN